MCILDLWIDKLVVVVVVVWASICLISIRHRIQRWRQPRQVFGMAMATAR
jgi:hypothetical protein